jgi:hypothetical protein
MLNGILSLKEGNERMSFLAYRWLHEPLTESGVEYYNKKDIKVHEAVVDAVSRYTGLDIKTYRGSEVAVALRKLHFDSQVAVCDVRDDGEHSILLNGREENCLLGFDPQWKSVSTRKVVPDAYETQPWGNGLSAGAVNVKIHSDYMVRRRVRKDRKGKFQLGSLEYRVLTVLEAM